MPNGFAGMLLISQDAVWYAKEFSRVPCAAVIPQSPRWNALLEHRRI